MFEYITGKVVQLTPTYAVIDNKGIGYFVNISLNTCASLVKNQDSQLFIHEVIREDAHDLFGFFEEKERAVFRALISVSGVGSNTARVMLSTLSSKEIESAIFVGDVNLLKSIKGIGAKTAQRIIIDLKDKVAKLDDSDKLFSITGNTSKEEALSALVMLGFPKNSVTKTLENLYAELDNPSVEQLVKEALKRL